MDGSPMSRLTALQVKSAAPGTHVDGKGLLLRVQPTGAKSWILRVQVDKRRRDIGLGSIDDLTLAEAREKSAMLRKIARAGGDPIAARDRKEQVIPTFAEAVAAAHAEKSKSMTDKSASQYLSSLKTHALPVIGHYRVDAIESAEVIAALAPIWTEKPQIARKVRHRIDDVLWFAKAHGWRKVDPPHSKEVTRGLARQPDSTPHKAMPYREIPKWFVGEMAKAPSPARLALLFTILTGSRQGEARMARWQQIDREAREWRRPASMMKARKAHDVTLNDAALAILDQAESIWGDSDLIFPSLRGKVLNDASLLKMLRDSGRDERVHGFRTSFRTWAAEKMPDTPPDVAELAQARTVGSAVERRYQRSSLLEMRRDLLEAWGQFVAPKLGAGNV